jgi:hypothetical protein
MPKQKCQFSLFMFLSLLSVATLFLHSSANAQVVRNSFVSDYKKSSKYPVTKKIITSRMDPRLLKAVQIAIQRSRSHSINRCWRYVKKALVEAEVVDSYPTTRYAKQAGGELLKFGFQPIDVADPFEAPVGSILVYGGRGPGHVEFRTQCGFVSDFLSPTPSPRPLIGVYIKMRNSEG